MGLVGDACRGLRCDFRCETRHFSHSVLAVPVLAGGDGVDGTALSFVVRRAVVDRTEREGGGGEGEGEEEGGAGEGGPGAPAEGPVVYAAPRRHEGDGGATLQGFLFVQAEEEEEEEEADRLVPPLFLAALVVDSDSGLLAVLVLLVTMYLALCFLLASPGPRCSASWPVWSRWTATVVWLGWYCW